MSETYFRHHKHRQISMEMEIALSKFLRAQVWCKCVATYSGRLAVARSFIRQWQ